MITPRQKPMFLRVTRGQNGLMLAGGAACPALFAQQNKKPGLAKRPNRARVLHNCVSVSSRGGFGFREQLAGSNGEYFRQPRECIHSWFSVAPFQ